MKSLPKFVVCGGHTVEVKIDNSLDPSEFGFFDSHEISITINGNKSLPAQTETLYHEILEMGNDLFELGLKHRQIQALGVILHQSLGDSILVPSPPSFSNRSPFLDRFSDAMIGPDKKPFESCEPPKSSPSVARLVPLDSIRREPEK